MSSRADSVLEMRMRASAIIYRTVQGYHVAVQDHCPLHHGCEVLYRITLRGRECILDWYNQPLDACAAIAGFHLVTSYSLESQMGLSDQLEF